MPLAQPPTIHVALVHDEPTPNLIAALDQRLATREVILVSDPTRQAQRAGIAQVLTRHGIRVTDWSVDRDWDLAHTRERLLELLAARERDPLALNLSGGSRPQSLAAHEVFRAFERPMFYVRPGGDELIWVYPPDQGSMDLADRLGLEDFLIGWGAEVEGQGFAGSNEERFPPSLTEGLLANQTAWGAWMPTLNWYTHQAEGDLISPAVRHHQLSDPDFAALLRHFGQHDLIRPEGDRLRFASEPARFFINGGWLETHVRQRLEAIAEAVGGWQDIAQGLRIARGGSRHPVRNEIDIAVLRDNRLYLIECKTKRFDRGDDSGADSLYKLDTLKDLLGGFDAQAMLVSYHALNDWDRARAADLGIAVCDGSSLQGLDNVLKDWLTERP